MGKKKRTGKAQDAIAVRFAWRGQRQTKKTLCTSSYSERLGTITPCQMDGEVARLYRCHWDQLRPASFRNVLDSKARTSQIDRQVVILIPGPVVAEFRNGRRPATIEKAVQKAVRVLDKHSQPINYHVVNALLAIYEQDTSRQYIHEALKASGFVKAFSVAKVPYWSKPVLA